MKYKKYDGDNQGNYFISNINAISNIYEYVAPMGGIPQDKVLRAMQLFASDVMPHFEEGVAR